MGAMVRALGGLAVLAAVVVAGCAPRTFQVSFPERDLVAPLDVILEDQTGLVLDVGTWEPGAIGWAEGASNPPNRQDQLVIGWLGGMCDHTTRLVFEAAGSGFRVTEQTDRADACRSAGVLRSVVLQLGAPIDAAMVEMQPMLGRPDG